MKRIFLVFICFFLISCASDPAKRQQVAIEETARMQPTSEKLSSFSHFELANMTLSQEVQERSEKVDIAVKLEEKLKEKLMPLINSWNVKSGSGDSGRTLEIQTKIHSLHVVSGGARFFAGALVGESHIDMDLIVVEKETGKVIGQTRIRRASSAMSGAWSVGRSDRNLLDYIVDIAHEYLVKNYERN